SSLGSAATAGTASTSGGSQVRKRPAFTKHATFARATEEGRLELVNHLGVELGDDPAHILDKLQRGDWSPADVTPPPEDTMETEYSEHVREIVDSPPASTRT